MPDVDLTDEQYEHLAHFFARDDCPACRDDDVATWHVGPARNNEPGTTVHVHLDDELVATLTLLHDHGAIHCTGTCNDSANPHHIFFRTAAADHPEPGDDHNGTA